MADAINIPELHEQLFQVCLDHQEKNPGFTFSVRKNESPRLNGGYWLLGDEEYAAASAYDWKDDNQKTQVIYLEVNGLDKPGSERVDLKVVPQEKHGIFFDRVMEKIGEILGKDPIHKKEGVSFFLVRDENVNFVTIKQEMVNFLENIVPEIDKIAEDENVLDLLKYGIIGKDKYERKFNKTKQKREAFKSRNAPQTAPKPQEDSAMSDEKQLNVIFYGPPGTGKTHHTINRALRIIEGKEPSSDPAYRGNLLERFNALKDAGQIEMITFHQNFAYEDFIEGIKPQLDDSADDGLSYRIKGGIFKKIAIRADENRQRGSDDYVEVTDINALLEAFINFVEERVDNDQPVPIYVNDNEKTIVEVVRDADDKFRYFELLSSDSKKRTMLRHTIINHYYEKFEEGEVTSSSDIHRYSNPDKRVSRAAQYLALFEEIKAFKEKQGGAFLQKKAKRENYVLIIDEINRGNIAKIFGELITLIEPSKRLGQEEALRVKLPYSQDEFGVPDNLYIIGTMNTADRSLTLLDTALRRRFDFEEMMPNPSLLRDTKPSGIDCETLLRTINARIKSEHEYGREHQIGHSYFMGKMEGVEDVKRTFQRNILPLLQEYFFDDWEKISKVLNENGFVRRDKGGGETWELLPHGDSAWNDAAKYTAIYKGAGNSTQSEGDDDADDDEGDADDS